MAPAKMLTFAMPPDRIAALIAERAADLVKQLPPGQRVELWPEHGDACRWHWGEDCNGCEMEIRAAVVTVASLPPELEVV